LLKKKDRLLGIINGVDYSIWDPSKDKFIFKQYDVASLDNKSYNKISLQKQCGLAESKDVFLLGFVGRLAEQKGIHLLADIIDQLKENHMQIVILGTGEQKYHNLLQQVSERYPNFLSLNLKFDEVLAHRIYAGADSFLMPSRYEPCGLGQLISFKYGTIPVVFRTGGLRDTVFDSNKDTQKGNGFVFEEYSKEEFWRAIHRAFKLFKNKSAWLNLVKKVMGLSFSWEDSAKKYLQLYNGIRKT